MNTAPAIINNDMPEVLYFGCLDRRRTGHALHSKRTPGISTRTGTPWGTKLDGMLLELNEPSGADGQRDTSPRNRIVIECKDGWTVVSFWDQSGDSRPASNSAFVVKDVWPIARDEVQASRLLALARQQWPEIFDRANFPLPRFNGRNIHCLPIDDGHFTGTDGVLHSAQTTCWCHPTPQLPGAPHVYAHHAKDGREVMERTRKTEQGMAADSLLDTSKPGWLAETSEPGDTGPNPGWLLVAEDY